MNVIDPTTKAPAERNPFFNAKPGSLVVDDMAIDKLLARGTIIRGLQRGAPRVERQVRARGRSDTRRRAQGVDGGNHSGTHGDSVRHLGRESRAGSGVLVLRWRMMRG